MPPSARKRSTLKDTVLGPIDDGILPYTDAVPRANDVFQVAQLPDRDRRWAVPEGFGTLCRSGSVVRNEATESKLARPLYIHTELPACMIRSGHHSANPSGQNRMRDDMWEERQQAGSVQAGSQPGQGTGWGERDVGHNAIQQRGDTRRSRHFDGGKHKHKHGARRNMLLAPSATAVGRARTPIEGLGLTRAETLVSAASARLAGVGWIRHATLNPLPWALCLLLWVASHEISNHQQHSMEVQSPNHCCEEQQYLQTRYSAHFHMAEKYLCLALLIRVISELMTSSEQCELIARYK
ncbi:hypothetical protein TgHK011_000258 [Trichoderma gracile]|nr:hypothetical protein TgHK011_000258 [Trichoderma gracile]